MLNKIDNIINFTISEVRMSGLSVAVSAIAVPGLLLLLIIYGIRLLGAKSIARSAGVFRTRQSRLHHRARWRPRTSLGLSAGGALGLVSGNATLNNLKPTCRSWFVWRERWCQFHSWCGAVWLLFRRNNW